MKRALESTAEEHASQRQCIRPFLTDQDKQLAAQQAWLKERNSQPHDAVERAWRILFGHFGDVGGDAKQAVDILGRYAEMNDIRAMALLGIVLTRRVNCQTETQWLTGTIWCEKAVAAFEACSHLPLSAETIAAIAQMKFLGWGTAIDCERACELAHRAAALGSAGGFFMLGNDFTAADRKQEIRAFYEEAASRGSAEAMYKLGCLDELGFSSGWKRCAAACEDLEAMHILANELYNEEQHVEAVKWLKRAVKSPFFTQRAFANYAYFVSCGKGCPLNRKLAVYLVEEAARRGCRSDDLILAHRKLGEGHDSPKLEALRLWFDFDTEWAHEATPIQPSDDGLKFQLIGAICRFGLFGVTQDDPTAFAMFKAAVEKFNDRNSMFHMAEMMRDGRGCNIDEKGAFHLFRLAAERSDPLAMVAHAQQLLEGRVCPRDTRAALIWLRQAAEEACPEAMLKLGDLYDGLIDGQGQVVEFNAQTALLMYVRAGQAARYYENHNVAWLEEPRRRIVGHVFRHCATVRLPAPLLTMVNGYLDEGLSNHELAKMRFSSVRRFGMRWSAPFRPIDLSAFE